MQAKWVSFPLYDGFYKMDPCDVMKQSHFNYVLKSDLPYNVFFTCVSNSCCSVPNIFYDKEFAIISCHFV